MRVEGLFIHDGRTAKTLLGLGGQSACFADRENFYRSNCLVRVG